MTGWILLHKKLLDWQWYDDINTCRVFIHLLLKANWKDNKWKNIEVKRGQLVTSISKLSLETGLSEQKVKTSLNKLKSSKEITIKPTNKYTLLIVNNYDTYQPDIETINKQTNNQITNKQQTNNYQITTTNKDNKDKTLNKEIKEERKERVKSFSQPAIEFSKYFFETLSESHQLRITANQKIAWQKTYDDLIKLDNYSHQEIMDVTKFGRESDFWSKNFLSATKLRKSNKDGVKYFIVLQEQNGKSKSRLSKLLT